LFLSAFSGGRANKADDAGVPASSSGIPGPAAIDPWEEQRRRDRADIERFLSGDTDGFEQLMNRYRQPAYGIALGLTGNHDDAMDTVQKSFLRIHRSLERFRLEEPFFPWMYRIVRNTALNQKRDEKRHQGDIPLEFVTRPDGAPDALATAEAADLRERLGRAIAELPEEMRTVFVMYHFQGHKYREIAAAMDIPLGTVMSRLHAARLRLRPALGLEEAP
jgi:RNA polymerase sigma-70 factor (ECF subfamily)